MPLTSLSHARRRRTFQTGRDSTECKTEYGAWVYRVRKVQRQHTRATLEVECIYRFIAIQHSRLQMQLLIRPIVWAFFVWNRRRMSNDGNLSVITDFLVLNKMVHRDTHRTYNEYVGINCGFHKRKK